MKLSLENFSSFFEYCISMTVGAMISSSLSLHDRAAEFCSGVAGSYKSVSCTVDVISPPPSTPSTSGGPPPPPPPGPPNQCSDGIDNDRDGLADPQFSSSADNSEAVAGFQSTPPQCSDGIDNDGDGRIDWNPNPALSDPGCSSASDSNETDPGRPTFIEVLPE